jgi:hypothetical protein
VRWADLLTWICRCRMLDISRLHFVHWSKYGISFSFLFLLPWLGNPVVHRPKLFVRSLI